MEAFSLLILFFLVIIAKSVVGQIKLEGSGNQYYYPDWSLSLSLSLRDGWRTTGGLTMFLLGAWCPFLPRLLSWTRRTICTLRTLSWGARSSLLPVLLSQVPLRYTLHHTHFTLRHTVYCKSHGYPCTKSPRLKVCTCLNLRPCDLNVKTKSETQQAQMLNTKWLKIKLSLSLYIY